MRTPSIPVVTLAILAACVSPPKAADRGEPATPAPKAEEPTELAAEIEDQKADIAAKERDLARANLKLEAGKAQAAIDLAAADLEVEKTTRELADAKTALERFNALGTPIQRAESQLEVDRAERRLVEARQDLAGILDIYEEEVEARSKDEVIQRHESRVAFAERELELAKQQAELDRQVELAKKKADLEWGIQEAAAAFEQAKKERDQARTEARLEELERQDAVAEVQDELRRLRRDVKKLEAKAEKARQKAGK